MNASTASISFDNGSTWQDVEILPIATDLPEVGRLIAIGDALPTEALELLKQIAQLERNAENLVIADPETLKFWDTAIAASKDWFRQIDEGRRLYTRPIDAIKNEMMERVRPLTERLKALTDKIGAAMTAYYKEQKRLDQERDAQRQLELTKQRDAAALLTASKLEAQGRTAAAQQVLKKALDLPAPPVKLPPTIPAKLAHARMETFVDWMIENSDELPREYLMPDENKIEARIKTFGLRHGIAGIAAWEDERIASVQTKRRA